MRESGPSLNGQTREVYRGGAMDNSYLPILCVFLVYVCTAGTGLLVGESLIPVVGSSIDVSVAPDQNVTIEVPPLVEEPENIWSSLEIFLYILLMTIFLLILY